MNQIILKWVDRKSTQKKKLSNPRHPSLKHSFGQKETLSGSANDKGNHTQNVNFISPLPNGNLQKWFYKRFEKSLRISLNFFLSEDRGHSFPDLWVSRILGEVKKENEGAGEGEDVFVLFLNPRPQFRVKEHSDSVLPPLSPSAKHKNQNLHTYVVLILDLVGYKLPLLQRIASWPTTIPSPSLGREGDLSEISAALSRLEQRERSRHNPPLPERRQRPLGWHAPFPRLGTQGWASFPRGSRSRGREGVSQYAAVLQARQAHSRDTCVCRAHPPAAPQSATRARSPPSHPGTQTAGWRVSSFTVLLLARPFYVSFPPRDKGLRPSLSARGQKSSRTRDP